MGWATFGRLFRKLIWLPCCPIIIQAGKVEGDGPTDIEPTHTPMTVATYSPFLV
jgi:hypothetical protein